MALILLYNANNLQLQADLDMSGLVWFRFFVPLFFFPPLLCRKISINFEVLERAACFGSCQDSDTNDLCFELPKET